MTENTRFGLVFAKTGSIYSGTGFSLSFGKQEQGTWMLPPAGIQNPRPPHRGACTLAKSYLNSLHICLFWSPTWLLQCIEGTLTHCKVKMPKIWNKYSQKRNIGVSVLISTFMCLWANYIFPRWGVCLFCLRKYVDQSWEYINRSQTHECGNKDWGRAIPRKGIHKRNCRCSAYRHKMIASLTPDQALASVLTLKKQALANPHVWITSGSSLWRDLIRVLSILW